MEENRFPWMIQTYDLRKIKRIGKGITDGDKLFHILVAYYNGSNGYHKYIESVDLEDEILDGIRYLGMDNKDLCLRNRTLWERNFNTIEERTIINRVKERWKGVKSTYALQDKVLVFVMNEKQIIGAEKRFGAYK